MLRRGDLFLLLRFPLTLQLLQNCSAAEMKHVKSLPPLHVCGDSYLSILFPVFGKAGTFSQTTTIWGRLCLVPFPLAPCPCLMTLLQIFMTLTRLLPAEFPLILLPVLNHFHLALFHRGIIVILVVKHFDYFMMLFLFLPFTFDLPCPFECNGLGRLCHQTRPIHGQFLKFLK